MPDLKTIRENSARTKTFKLEDTSWAGTEVTVRDDLTIGEVQRFMTQDEETLMAWADDVLMDWNLTDDGEEVPANAEGMEQVPLVLGLNLLAEWQLQIAGEDTPLGRRLRRLTGTARGSRSRTGR